MSVDRAGSTQGLERTLPARFRRARRAQVPTVGHAEDEMKCLHQHLFWRVSKEGSGPSSREGDRLLDSHPERSDLPGDALAFVN